MREAETPEITFTRLHKAAAFYFFPLFWFFFLHITPEAEPSR